MRKIDGFLVRGGEKQIELWQGDLTDWPEGTTIDALVVSAFQGNYVPTRSSVIGALDRKGVSVTALARHKDVDAVDQYSCWLSTPLAARPGLPYRHILCFEPTRGKAPELVGDIFRALVPIAGSRPDIRSVAMPVLGTGNQRYAVDDMLPAILDASVHWLEMGIPLDRIAIVTHSDEQAARATAIFTQRRQAYLQSAPPPAPEAAYDVFISYSHANKTLAGHLVAKLLEHEPGLRIFLDRVELNVGAAWQLKIFESLARSRKVVALISPEYLASKVCQEEFNMAWMRARSADERVLLPVYAYTASLPVWVQYWQYVDCREGDEARLDLAVAEVMKALNDTPSSIGTTHGSAVMTAPPSSPAVPLALPVGGDDRMPCPRCAESIKKAARMCRFCYMELSPTSSPG